MHEGALNWIIITKYSYRFRCLLRWIKGDHGYKKKWKANNIAAINLKLKNLVCHKPREIHRSVRNLDVLAFWKGTELRSFLLYYGMVVLKGDLEENEYKHFLLLVCATHIFYTNSYRLYRIKADEWLNRYIEDCINIYGISSITSNFHNLVHVFEDVKRFGSLQEISTYPFENRLNFLKSRLKQPNLPLEQISRRLVELSVHYDDLYSFNSEKECMPKFRFPFTPEQLPCPNGSISFENLDNHTIFYKEISTEFDYMLSCKGNADKWFLTFSNDIVQFEFAAYNECDTTIFGKTLIHKTNFFKYPSASMYLNIFESNGVVGNLKRFRLLDIKAKMICLPSEEMFVFIPLLHTLK